MKEYNIAWTHEDEKINFIYHADDNAEIIRLLKCLITLSRCGEIPEIDFSSTSARRQWDDGIHETIIEVFFDQTDIYAFEAVYNCNTFNFDYVSETLPA